MAISFKDILKLVGPLTDDKAGSDTARERFRKFLKENVTNPGQVRDFVELCISESSTQNCRALQDLVNHLGELLGFDVDYGRYTGSQNEIGYDGLWSSQSSKYFIVVEVKTTDAFTIQTSTLLNYIDRLIEAGKIQDRDHAIGLYVVGRQDSGLKQLESSIKAQKQGDSLRICLVSSLLTLADLINSYDVEHKDIETILWPSGPSVNSIIDIISTIIGETTPTPESISSHTIETEKLSGADNAFWLTPVSGDGEQTAEECVQQLVAKEGIYALGERTPGRNRIKIGDGIAFYSTGIGVIAYATVASQPDNKPNKAVRDSERYPYVFRVKSPVLFLKKPILLDASMRAQLDAFKERDQNAPWAWFVQSTRSISKHDFELLTKQNNDALSAGRRHNQTLPGGQ